MAGKYLVSLTAKSSNNTSNSTELIDVTLTEPFVAPNAPPMFKTEVKQIEISLTDPETSFKLPETLDPNAGDTVSVSVSGLDNSFMSYSDSSKTLMFDRSKITKSMEGKNYEVTVTLTD